MDNIDKIADKIAKDMTAGISEDDIWKLYAKGNYFYSSILQGMVRAIEKMIREETEEDLLLRVEREKLNEIVKILGDAQKKILQKDKILKAVM